MDIGALNERILFQKNEVISDEIGNHINKWTDYYSCFATISGEGGTEKQETGQTIEATDISFTIRWCKKASKITSTCFRVIFRDEIYNVTLVDHLNFKKNALKFKCQKVRR